MRKAALTLVLGLGLLLAGCGDDDDTDTATTATTVTTAAASVTTTTTSAAGPSTTISAGTLECQTVGFTPNSEDAASSVRATGLSCAEAEAFVRVAGTRTSSGGPAEVDVEGYHCVRTASQQDPLPTSSYECTNGGLKVTFVRS